MNKKRKIILKLWIIFILIILLILLFLLGLRLPKLFKSIQDKNKVETQSQYQTQYIHDTNKVQNIIGLMNSLKRLKELKNKQLQKQVEKQEQPQIINNLDFFDTAVQNELYHKLSKSMDDKMSQFSQKDFASSQVQTEQSNDDNKLVKDIAVVTLATGAVVISCVVLAPIFASVGPIALKSAAVVALL